MRVILGAPIQALTELRGCCLREVAVFAPWMVRPTGVGGVPRLGHRLLDDYVQMVAARSRMHPRKPTAEYYTRLQIGKHTGHT
jgi:hypothetical protein